MAATSAFSWPTGTSLGGEAASPTIFLSTAVLTIALFSASDLYTGPVARLPGGADIGYYVGFFLAGLWYAAAARARRPAPTPCTPASTGTVP